MNNKMHKGGETKLHVKVVINKEKSKVLFAEAGSDFTDVLLSFLLLPLGTIVEVLDKHYGGNAPRFASIDTLYKGVQNLDTIHFQTVDSKRNLLVSTSCYDSESYKLRLKLNSTRPSSSGYEGSYDGVFTQSTASFIISDDLRVMPNVAGSIMKTLTSLGIAVGEMDGAETRDVTFGLDEVVALLKESLVSLNPMTALVFPHRRRSLSREGDILLHDIGKQVTTMNHKKMNVKAMVQKSTKKLVFAQVDYDFINFLFGLLIIPFGKVEWFLGSDTGVKSMDNLHRSVADDSTNMHLKNSETKDLLIKSTRPTSNCCRRSTPAEFYNLNFACDYVNQHHVKEARMYMVSDDLIVAPLGMTSGLSVINELKISLSDVEEAELRVGLEEGLSIVKAALTSNTALTHGLIEPVMKKQAHQEMEQKIKVEEALFI